MWEGGEGGRELRTNERGRGQGFSQGCVAFPWPRRTSRKLPCLAFDFIAYDSTDREDICQAFGRPFYEQEHIEKETPISKNGSSAQQRQTSETKTA